MIVSYMEWYSFHLNLKKKNGDHDMIFFIECTFYSNTINVTTECRVGKHTPPPQHLCCELFYTKILRGQD